MTDTKTVTIMWTEHQYNKATIEIPANLSGEDEIDWVEEHYKDWPDRGVTYEVSVDWDTLYISDGEG
jgi:hypothetical protein